MNKARILFVLLMYSVLVNAQQHQKGDVVKGVYIGIVGATDFQKAFGGLNLQVELQNTWGLGLEFFENRKRASNLPPDYQRGLDLNIFIDSEPVDYLQSFSILVTKRIAMDKNVGAKFLLGPSIVYQQKANFEFTGGSWLGSNYEYDYNVRQGFGIVSKAGFYLTAAPWCGFQVDVLVNLNDFRNYAALCLTWNLGWMPKER